MTYQRPQNEIHGKKMRNNHRYTDTTSSAKIIASFLRDKFCPICYHRTDRSTDSAMLKDWGNFSKNHQSDAFFKAQNHILIKIYRIQWFHMSRVSLCRRSHYSCVVLHERNSTYEHTRLLTVRVLEYFTDNMMGGIKNKMELHPPFRKKKRGTKGKKLWPMQKTRGKSQDE